MILKSTLSIGIIALLMFGSANKTQNKNTDEFNNGEAMKEMQSLPATGTIMQIVKAKTELSEEEFLRIAREREPQFKAIPGLIQKYYIKTNHPGEYGGVYIWDSMESLNEYRESDLAATIGKAYNTTEPPSIEIVDIVFELR